MPIDVFDPSIDGAVIDGHNASVVNKSGFNPGTGLYTIGYAQGFHGSYNDFFTFDPSVNIASFSLAGFSNHGTLETLHGGDPPTFTDLGPVITFTQNYSDGTSGFPFGGVVIGAGFVTVTDAVTGLAVRQIDRLLVDQVTGFFDLGTVNPTTGGEVFVGTVEPGSFQIFEYTTNLSLKSGIAPTLPIVFQQACYQAGTHLRTEHGETRVEDLQVGDLVAVIEGPAVVMRPVVWIGHRRIEIAGCREPRTAWPIRIRRDAFAEGSPSRDLLVSPDHAIFTDGVLIPAKLLVNAGSIRQDTSLHRVHYFHVELERHGVLIAEGLPAESYLDCGNRHSFANTAHTTALWPDPALDRSAAAGPHAFCHRMAEDAATVRPVWARLAGRSAGLGFAMPAPVTVTDPDLLVTAAGRQLAPVSADNGSYRFLLPEDATNIDLISASAIPGEIRPWLADRRRLGVSVIRLRLRCGAELTEIALDGPNLGEGWWAMERHGQMAWRWTNGHARIVLPDGPPFARLLEVEIGGGGEYAVPTAGGTLSRAA